MFPFYDLFRPSNDEDELAAFDDWMEDLRRDQEEIYHDTLDASYDELLDDQDAGLSVPVIDAVYDPYVTPAEYQYEPVALVNGKEVPLSEIERYARQYDIDVFGV